MSKPFQQYDAVNFYSTPRSEVEPAHYFSPTAQSLKSAHKIIRQYEKSRERATQGATGRPRRSRETTVVARAALDPAGRAGGGDIVPIIVPAPRRGAPRASLRSSAGRSAAPFSDLWRADVAPRAAVGGEPPRTSPFAQAYAAPPHDYSEDLILKAVPRDAMLERLCVMTIQAMAVVLGFGGLLALVKLF